MGCTREDGEGGKRAGGENEAGYICPRRLRVFIRNKQTDRAGRTRRVARRRARHASRAGTHSRAGARARVLNRLAAWLGTLL